MYKCSRTIKMADILFLISVTSVLFNLSIVQCTVRNLNLTGTFSTVVMVHIVFDSTDVQLMYYRKVSVKS